jgi:hypothetical protein
MGGGGGGKDQGPQTDKHLPSRTFTSKFLRKADLYGLVSLKIFGPCCHLSGRLSGRPPSPQPRLACTQLACPRLTCPRLACPRLACPRLGLSKVGLSMVGLSMVGLSMVGLSTVCLSTVGLSSPRPGTLPTYFPWPPQPPALA